MNTRRFCSALGISVLAALLAGFGGPVYADDDDDERYDRHRRHETSCSSRIVGSYLTTIANSEGAAASRSIMTFHADGTLTAVDSAQGRGLQNAGFSAQLGTYKCKSRRRANAITLNFGFTDPPDLARTDWTISFDRKRRSVQGTAILFILPDANSADPFADGLQPIATFTFDGARLPARARGRGTKRPWGDRR